MIKFLLLDDIQLLHLVLVNKEANADINPVGFSALSPKNGKGQMQKTHMAKTKYKNTASSVMIHRVGI